MDNLVTYVVTPVSRDLYNSLKDAVIKLENATRILSVEQMRKWQCEVKDLQFKFMNESYHNVDTAVPWEILCNETRNSTKVRAYKVVLNDTDEALITRALKAQDAYFGIVLGAKTI